MIEDLLDRLLSHFGQPSSAYEVATIPRQDRLSFLGHVESSLISAYHTGARVFTAWIHHVDEPFQVVLGGTHGFPTWSPLAREPGRLLWPAGVGADPVGAGPGRLACLAAFSHWLRVAGMRAVRTDQERPDEQPPAVEDHLDFLAHRSFALLCVAVPVAISDVQLTRSAVAEQFQTLVEQGARGSSALLTDAVRAELVDLTEALASGLWNVHLFVGADSPQAAFEAAGLWSAGTRHLRGAPMRYAPIGDPARLSEVVRASVRPTDSLRMASPFQAGSTALACFARPPLREIPGVRAKAANPFDVAAIPEPDGLPFGDVLDGAGSPVGTLRVPLSSLAKHTFVHGATGAGKSQATRHLLTEFTRRGIPWIVLEPAKSEYATAMSERLAGIAEDIPDPSLVAVHLIKPGDVTATGISLNPLEPEPGSHYQAHLDALVDLAVAAFDADSPFPEVLTQAVDVAVRTAGWDPGLSQPLQAVRATYREGTAPMFPGIADLVRACHTVISSKGYSKEIEGNVRGFVDMRLGTLSTGTKRAAFSTGYPLSLESVLCKNVVFELQDLGTDSDRALFMGLFLLRLAQAARVRHARDPRPGQIRNVVVIEEAHRLLRRTDRLEGAAARAVESFTDLLAEVRSQGVSLVVAEQIPAKIAEDVVKNTAVKCMGRTPAADDRAFVGAAIGMTEEQSERVVSLAPGQFAVHTDRDDSPLLVRFPYVAERGDRQATDPAPLGTPLPSWFGAAAAPGTANQSDMARATQWLGDARWILLCELMVAAYLVHKPLPDPGPIGARVLTEPLGERRDVVLDLLVGQLVQQAVLSRRPALGPYPAEDLCDEVARVLRAALTGTAPPVRAGERWMSSAHMWFVIRHQLRAPGDETRPHPKTEQWRGWGVAYVPDVALPAQREAVDSDVFHVRGTARTALLGTLTPSTIATTLRRYGWPAEEGLREAVKFLRNHDTVKPLRDLIVAELVKPGAST